MTEAVEGNDTRQEPPAEGEAHPGLPGFLSPGQLTLLLQPPSHVEALGQDDLTDVNASLLESLAPTLARFFRIETHEQLLKDGSGNDRLPVLVDDTEEGRKLVLQTVNLPGWMDQTEFNKHAGQEMGRIPSDAIHAPGVTQVGQALVNFAKPVEVEQALKGQQYWPVAASPNWLAVAFCICGGPCPGGRPVAPPSPPLAPARPPRFRTGRAGRHRPDGVLEAVRRRVPADEGAAEGADIVVALLDSFPVGPATDVHGRVVADGKLGKVRACYDRLANEGSAAPYGVPVDERLWRLKQAVNQQIVDEGDIVDYTDRLAPGLRACPHHAYFDKTPSVADHGLFVADIVKDVAPRATIWMYRVFTDDGVSDLHTIAQAAGDAIERARGRKLIINLSGGFGPQTGRVIRLLEGLKDPNVDLRRLYDEIEHSTPVSPQVEIRELMRSRLLERAGAAYHFRNELGPLDKVFSQTGGDTNVLVVAATGNDSYHHRGPIPFGPRLPAGIESVVAVSAYVPDRSAGRGRWRRASYANDDDLFPGNDGIGAYGGETTSSGASDVDDAPVGLYVSDAYPDGSPNTTGWARWSGTSFACPVVAGFAAALWSADPNLRAGQLRSRIYGPPGARDPEYLPFRQTPV